MSIAGMTDPQRRPTIYDVADRAAVSKSLVSLVLRGSPQVSEKRRAAVLSAIAELGYQPSQAATLLASSRTRSVEILIDEYRNLSFVGLVDGVREALTGQDFYLTVTETRQPTTRPAAGQHTSVTPADGRILAAEPSAAVLAGWRNCPTVVAGHRQSIPDGADVVANDDEQGSRIACDHLATLGHHHIGHLTGSGGAAQLRRAGFITWMQRAGLPGRIAGEGGGTTEQDGYNTANDLLDRYPATTAIFAANDLMALGALAAIREHRRTVPGDISVIGYDNSPLAQSRYLALTSIADQSTEVGAAAARALLVRIDDPHAAPIHTLVEPTLMVRQTTARVRPSAGSAALTAQSMDAGRNRPDAQGSGAGTHRDVNTDGGAE